MQVLIIIWKLITTKVGCRAVQLEFQNSKELYISRADKAVSISLHLENTTNIHFLLPCKTKVGKKLKGRGAGSHWGHTLSFSDSLQIYKYSSAKWIYSFFPFFTWVSIQMAKFMLVWRSSTNLKCLWSSLSWLKRKGLGAFRFLPCPFLAISKRHFSQVAVHVPSLLLNFRAFCLL